VSIATHRLRSQRLVGTPFDRPDDAVRWLGAVQSQDYPGGKWALGLRMRDATDASLDRAFDAGAIIRTHVLRPTWHFVAPEDLRWMLALTGPRVLAVNKGMERQLELDAKICRRANALFTKALRDGRTLTRVELAALLATNGIEASGPRLAYIVMHAELTAQICSGPMRGKQHTYALLEERVPPAPTAARDEALGMLARRYFTSHGPASAHDFSWWSGLTVSDARAAIAMIASELEELTVDGKPLWAPPDTAESARVARRLEKEKPVVHLLPNYDEHVVAYRDHGHSVDPVAKAALRTRTDGTLGAHLISRDGLIVGGWQRSASKSSVGVRTKLLVALRPPERMALRRAAESYGRFMGLPAVLEGDS
jgi:hypothetical protein